MEKADYIRKVFQYLSLLEYRLIDIGGARNFCILLMTECNVSLIRVCVVVAATFVVCVFVPRIVFSSRVHTKKFK